MPLGHVRSHVSRVNMSQVRCGLESPDLGVSLVPFCFGQYRQYPFQGAHVSSIDLGTCCGSPNSTKSVVARSTIFNEKSSPTSATNLECLQNGGPHKLCFRVFLVFCGIPFNPASDRLMLTGFPTDLLEGLKEPTSFAERCFWIKLKNLKRATRNLPLGMWSIDHVSSEWKVDRQPFSMEFKGSS